MELVTVNEILLQNLQKYDEALGAINQCTLAYEDICQQLILEIANSTSEGEALKQFDALSEIQMKLSKLLFSRSINIGQRLENFVREFDRINDEYIRRYWYDKFKQGTTWPDQD